MAVVGIPRGLLYYRWYPFWRTFFEELGVEVVSSPHTTRRILHDGLKHTNDEVCLPVKVYCGHAMAFEDRVDAVFVPRMASVEKRNYICAKFLGLPDVIRNCVPGIPEVLTEDFDVNRQPLWRSSFELGRKFCRNPLKVARAYRLAAGAQEDFSRRAQEARSAHGLLAMLEGRKTAAETGETREPRHGCRIGLVGHCYNLYDNYVNLDIISRLESLGAEVMIPDMLPPAAMAREARRLSRELYWTYGREILGAAGYFADGRVDGIILLISFACGPDSLLAELAIRKLRDSVPMMLVVIDEETGEAGLMTRLESFVEMVQRRKRVAS